MDWPFENTDSSAHSTCIYAFIYTCTSSHSVMYTVTTDYCTYLCIYDCVCTFTTIIRISELVTCYHFTTPEAKPSVHVCYTRTLQMLYIPQYNIIVGRLMVHYNSPRGLGFNM